MHKMDVKLDPEMIYCLMATPQWDLQESNLLPYAYQAMSQIRQSLKVNLFAPCPDPELESIPASAQHNHLETQKIKLATPTRDKALADQNPASPEGSPGLVQRC
jgi:hypothetical protein